MLGDRLRPWLRPIRQWAPVALEAPQLLVRASFAGADVTDDHVVASLDPLTLAIGRPGAARGRLVYVEQASGRLLGWLDLETCGSFEGIALFRVTASDHRCLPWPLRPWNRRLQARAQTRGEQPASFSMTPIDVERLMIAYLCPRPVVLVSVASPEHANLFPMDLIGPLAGDRFTLALRKASLSIPAMLASGRVALCDAPADAAATVFALGAHHKRPTLDWLSLPFTRVESAEWRLPVPAEALRIREFAIEQTREIGSHWFLVGRTVTERVQSCAPQLHHVPGFYRHDRRMRGLALADASA